MLTPQNAFDLVQKSVKGFDGDPIVSDFGSFYSVSDSQFGDMDTNGEYKIDKITGEISEFTFLEYTTAVGKLGDELPKTYKVKSLK